MFFKSFFHLKIYQNNFFIYISFIFDTNTSKSLKNTIKNINLMFFQDIHGFKKAFKNRSYHTPTTNFNSDEFNYCYF